MPVRRFSRNRKMNRRRSRSVGRKRVSKSVRSKRRTKRKSLRGSSRYQNLKEQTQEPWEPWNFKASAERAASVGVCMNNFAKWKHWLSNLKQGYDDEDVVWTSDAKWDSGTENAHGINVSLIEQTLPIVRRLGGWTAAKPYYNFTKGKWTNIDPLETEP
jgi:hypothetical protein